MSNFKRGGNFGGGNFKKPNFRSGSNKFGGSRFGGGNFNHGGSDRENGQMFDAVCGNCGKNCQVPFRPNGRKPVLCSDCFQNEKKSGFQGNRPNRSDSRPSAPAANYKQDFEAINAKLDKILRLLNTTPSQEMYKAEDELKDILETIEAPKKPAKKKKTTSKKETDVIETPVEIEAPIETEV